MCRILSRSLEEVIVSMLERNFDIARISFTRDNFMKFAFIYMRLRVGQTVIIMGETGIGKTAIISYLAEVLNYEFRVLNLHEGILEKDILTFVHDA
jgi:MoxR-like ATPase